MAETMHVFPINDLIEHDTSNTGESCVCGPTVKPIKCKDGSVGWVITHNSLDGREAREQEEETMSDVPRHASPTPSGNTLAPEAKVTAAGVSAAAATLIIFIAGMFGLEVSAEVAAAAVTVVAFVAAYVAPHTRRGVDA